MNAGYLYLLTNFQNKPRWLATNQLNFTQNTNLVDRTWLWPDKVFMCTKVVGNIPWKKYKWSIVNNLTRSNIIKREVLPTEDVLIHVHFFKNSIIIFMRVVWHSCFMNQHFQVKQCKCYKQSMCIGTQDSLEKQAEIISNLQSLPCCWTDSLCTSLSKTNWTVSTAMSSPGCIVLI